MKNYLKRLFSLENFKYFLQDVKENFWDNVKIILTIICGFGIIGVIGYWLFLIHWSVCLLFIIIGKFISD